MSLDVDDLASKMFGAAFPIVKQTAPQIANYVAAECKKFALTIAAIETERESGDLDQEEAAILIGMQRTSMSTVLTAAQGLSALMAQTAINAAIGAVRDLVNGVFGFALL